MIGALAKKPKKPGKQVDKPKAVKHPSEFTFVEELEYFLDDLVATPYF